MEDPELTQEHTSDLVAWWLEKTRPVDDHCCDLATLIACVTSKLLSSPYSSQFKKHLDRWTETLTTSGDMIKSFDEGGFNSEMALLLALSIPPPTVAEFPLKVTLTTDGLLM